MDILRELQATWPPWAFEVLKFGNGLLLLGLVFVPLERVFAERAQPVRRAGWKTDVAYYFLSSLLPPKLVVLAVLTLVWAMQAWAPEGLFPALAELPLWARFPAALVVAEAGFYWAHRWMHASPWLWRFHAVHHSATSMDWLVNTRAHPLDLTLMRLCGLLPLYGLGLSRIGGPGIDALPLMVALFMTAWGYLIHANIRFQLAPLQPLLATPAFHHWHHENVGTTGLRHSNYAATLPVMDLLFGTYRRAGSNRPKRFGTDEPVPDLMFDQLMLPFMGKRKHAAGIDGYRDRPASARIGLEQPVQVHHHILHRGVVDGALGVAAPCRLGAGEIGEDADDVERGRVDEVGAARVDHPAAEHEMKLGHGRGA